MSAEAARFFEDYERATNARDIDALASHYAETFMFGGPGGTQSVQREDFVRVLPMRQQFFEKVGLKRTTLVALEAKPLAPGYVFAEATWRMRYEKDGTPPIEDDNGASYILFDHDGALRIVFQLDHQDLTKKAEALGLV
jgi:ketosteroid isomerase-like protein